MIPEFLTLDGDAEFTGEFEEETCWSNQQKNLRESFMNTLICLYQMEMRSIDLKDTIFELP